MPEAASADGGETVFEGIIEASRLVETLDVVDVLVQESKVHVDPDGIGIRAVDPANVGMVDLGIDKQAFESYQGSGRIIGIDVERLQEFLGMAESDDLVKLDFDDETGKLHIKIDGLEGTIGLIDPNSIRQEPDIPDLDLPATAVIEGRHLSRGVDAANLVSDNIELGVDADEQVMFVDADGDTDDVHLELGSDDYDSLDASGDALSIFSLDYLADMESAIPADAEVEVRLGEEFPAKIAFELADGHASVEYVLAPRIRGD